MTFWMRNHARSLSKELRARAEAALDGKARWGLGLLAFQAVGREGLETVVFTLAIVFSTSPAGAWRTAPTASVASAASRSRSAGCTASRTLIAAASVRQRAAVHARVRTAAASAEVPPRAARTGSKQ